MNSDTETVQHSPAQLRGFRSCTSPLTDDKKSDQKGEPSSLLLAQRKLTRMKRVCKFHFFFSYSRNEFWGSVHILTRRQKCGEYRCDFLTFVESLFLPGYISSGCFCSLLLQQLIYIFACHWTSKSVSFLCVCSKDSWQMMRSMVS